MIYVLGSGDDYVTVNSDVTIVGGEWFSLDENSDIYYMNTDADWYDTFYGAYGFSGDTSSDIKAYSAGDTVTVEYCAYNVDALAAVELYLGYNSDVLTFEECSPDDCLMAAFND